MLNLQVTVSVEVSASLNDDGTFTIHGAQVVETVSDDFTAFDPETCEWLSKGEMNELTGGLDLLIASDDYVARTLTEASA